MNAHLEIPTFLDPRSARGAGRILWKFDDDADRRRHWKAVFANTDFMAFAVKLRPSIMTQEAKLLLAAPWGPHP